MSMQNCSIGSIRTGEYPLIVVPFTDRSLSSGVTPSDADIIELRVDMFSDTAVGSVVASTVGIRDKFGKPLIVTVRRSEEGGAMTLNDDERLAIFRALLDHCDAVDIEIGSDIFGSVVAMAQRHRKTVIGSFHDFSGTPEINELIRIVEKGRSFTADIVKIAVMPKSRHDLQTLTALTLKYCDQGIITIGMGLLGTASRLYLPMIGSLMAYASLDEETAPGQLSLAEMRRHFSLFTPGG